MLPLARPGLIALGVLTTLWSWNDLLWPLIVNTDPEKMPLSAGLASLQGQRLTDFPVLMAGALLASVPDDRPVHRSCNGTSSQHRDHRHEGLTG